MGLTEEHIDVLSGRNPQQKLSLFRRGLTAEDARIIAEKLKTNTTLRKLE